MARMACVKITLLLVTVLLCLPTTGTWAQEVRGVDPGAIQQRAIDTMEYYRLEKKLREEKKPELEKDWIEDKTKEEVKPAPEADEKAIFISRIVTDRSEILSDEEIKGVTGKYEGKSASIKDLFEVIREINELYRAKKFIAAQAVLPPQKVEEGVVQIKLVEGRVGKIFVEDNKHTRESFFRNRISLKSGDLVRLDNLEKDLLLFNSINDVKIKTELKPGEAFGTTDCIVKVQEPSKYQVALFSDNAGRDTVGLYRFGLVLGDSSLLGYRDPLSLSAFWANGNGTIAGSGSYSFPITTLGTRLGVSYDHNQIKVISGPSEVLDISGDSSDFGIDLSHPFIVKPAFKLNGFTGFHFKKSTTDFDEVTLFQTKVRGLTFGFDFQSFDEGGYWHSHHKLTRGFYILGGDASFLKYNLFLMRQQILGKDFVFVFRGSAQLSDRKLLPSSEQFQIGGMSSVRGYPEGLLTGDRGYLLNGELYFPLPFTKKEIFGTSLGDKLKGFIFVDHGGAFPFKGHGESINNNDYLTSTGFGLMINISKYLTGRLSLGVPIANREQVKDSFRFHFYLQSNIL